MRRSYLHTFAFSVLLPLAAGCLPTGGNGSSGGVVIDDGDGGTSSDSGDNDTSNNTTPTTKTCSDGTVVPIAQPCNCPTSATDCDDGNPCTTEVFTSGADCGTCSSSVVSTCGAIDGCCPQVCSPDNDSDCGGCGNGRVEPGETCDGECPTDLFECPEPTRACQRAVLIGEADLCTAECAIEEITACGEEDGCCPEACGRDEDSDCAQIPILHGEACAADPEACDSDCLTRDIDSSLPEDGICSRFQCESDSDCNNDTSCISIDGGGPLTLCARACTFDSDCRRDDVECTSPSNGSQAFCF